MTDINYCKACGVFGEAEICPINSAGIPYCWNCGTSKDGKNEPASCINCGFLFCSNSGFSDPMGPCDIDQEPEYETESVCSQCGGDMDIECWLLPCETEKLQRQLHDNRVIKEEEAS